MELFGITWGAAILWIALAIVLAIVEAMTVGLLTIWFSVGALVASILAYLGVSFWLQLLVFFMVSLLLLYYTKPLAEKKLRIGAYKNNIDAMQGKAAMVIDEIPAYGTGQVKLAGLFWTAVTATEHAPIPVGRMVKVLGVEGVKVIVEPLGMVKPEEFKEPAEPGEFTEPVVQERE